MFTVLQKNKNVNTTNRAITILKSAGPFALEEAFDACPKESKPFILQKRLFNPCNLCGSCDISESYIIHDSDKKWTTNFESTTI